MASWLTTIPTSVLHWWEPPRATVDWVGGRRSRVSAQFICSFSGSVIPLAYVEHSLCCPSLGAAQSQALSDAHGAFPLYSSLSLTPLTGRFRHSVGLTHRGRIVFALAQHENGPGRQLGRPNMHDAIRMNARHSGRQCTSQRCFQPATASHSPSVGLAEHTQRTAELVDQSNERIKQCTTLERTLCTTQHWRRAEWDRAANGANRVQAVRGRALHALVGAIRVRSVRRTPRRLALYTTVYDSLRPPLGAAETVLHRAARRRENGREEEEQCSAGTTASANGGEQTRRTAAQDNKPSTGTQHNTSDANEAPTCTIDAHHSRSLTLTVSAIRSRGSAQRPQPKRHSRYIHDILLTSAALPRPTTDLPLPPVLCDCSVVL